MADFTAQQTADDYHVEISDLKKSYNLVPVLKEINLRIKARERLVICGPSGSGKSTLIRCIGGLESFDSGQMTVFARAQAPGTTNHPGHKGRISMVFQSFNLFPHMSILTNCTLAPRRVLKLTRQAAEERAMSYLTRLGIADQARKYPSQLSGGQQQRAAICRALCMEPEVVLFDEPTSALDPEKVKEVLAAMTELAGMGITMICVTHELNFARQIADRVLFMDEGRIVEEGPPDALFDSPQTGRLQQFLSNVL